MILHLSYTNDVGGRHWWGREAGREWWCWASRFCSGAVVHVCGHSFLFIAGVVVSWALAVSGWGVIVVHGAPSLSMGVVVCGHSHCLWGWVLSLVGMVIIHGAGLSFADAVSSLVGAGCR